MTTSGVSRFGVLLVSAILFCLPALGAPVQGELKDEAGKFVVKYAVEAPPGLAPANTTDPTRQVGLFLCAPEHDRPTGDEIMPIRESLRRQGLLNEYVILAVSPQERKFGPADHEPMLRLLAWAKKTYPINPRRIYMYGKGEGGKISGEFAGMHRNWIAAAITYSWGFWVMPSEIDAPLAHLPRIYMVLGLNDLATHLSTVRETYNRVRAKGYRVIYREFDGLAGRTYHPPSNDDSIAWAVATRNPNVAASAEETNLLKAFAKGTPPAPDHRGIYPALALVGGSEAGAVVQKLIESKDAAVRAAAAESCARAQFDDATIAVVGSRILDPSPAVRRAVIHALTIHANWRSEPAQQALIRLVSAAESKAALEDRIGALDGLANAVRYQVKGVRQDPEIFRTLVALQSSKEEELRNMAIAVLLPVRDSVLKPLGEKPDRAAVAAAWQKWVDEVTDRQAGFLTHYKVCGYGQAYTGAELPGNREKQEPVDLFCSGGSKLLGYNLATGERGRVDLAGAFQSTLAAAEKGYVPAQAVVGMMYAVGKGVELNRTAGNRWWAKAAEGGDPYALEWRPPRPANAGSARPAAAPANSNNQNRD